MLTDARPGLRRLSMGLLTSAVAIAPMPLKAQDSSAGYLGDVMGANPKDLVKLTSRYQGAFTPYQTDFGGGGGEPLSVGESSVGFLDALINVNVADSEGNSSSINTTIAGTTVSTSASWGTAG